MSAADAPTPAGGLQRPLRPQVWQLPENSEMFTVHPLETAAGIVDPGSFPLDEQLRESRFGPLSSGPTVHHLGTTAVAALAETLLHDIGGHGRLMPEQYEGHAISAVRSTRVLRVAVLAGEWLEQAGADLHQLTRAPVGATSRAFAQAVHEDTDLDGLLWTTRAGGNDRAVALFTDRAADVFRFDGNSAALASPGGFEWLAGMCHRLDVRVLPAT